MRAVGWAYRHRSANPHSPTPPARQSHTQRRVNDRSGHAERVKHHVDVLIALADMQHGAGATATGRTDGRESFKPALLRGAMREAVPAMSVVSTSRGGLNRKVRFSVRDFEIWMRFWGEMTGW